MIGYLDVELHEPLGYFGGILVADEFGLPVEFRHTLPVRPTKLQRAIYGDALDRYVRAVVIAQRLVAGPRAPAGHRAGQRRRAARRRRSADGPPGRVGRRPRRRGGRGRAVHRRPARASCCSCRSGEAPLRIVTQAPPHLYPELGRALFGAAETMDLHEPMSRVRAGLGLIAQGDVAAA